MAGRQLSETKRAIDLVLNGMPVRAAALAVGITYPTLYRALRRAGVPVRPYNRQ